MAKVNPALSGVVELFEDVIADPAKDGANRANGRDITFPDGRTLHLSTDGPMPGYELAQADAERNGGRRPGAEPQKRSLIASLFNGFRGQQDPEEADDATTEINRSRRITSSTTRTYP